MIFSSESSFAFQIAPPDSVTTNKVDSLPIDLGDSLPATKDAFKTDVTYYAKDSIYFDVENKIVYLWGDTKMHYEKTDLQAAYSWIDFKNNVLHAEPLKDSLGNEYGKPVFKDGDKEFHVDKIVYNFKTKRGKISGLVTKEGDGIIYCTDVKKDADDNLYGKDARYSTCIDTLHPHFYIHVSKLKIIPKKQIISGPANLYIDDVPTPAFVPFGFFPISQGQKKGFLFPTYGESPGIGFFLRNLGYYIPINQHMDLKLLTDIYTNTSWGATISSSYNYIYKYKGNFTFLYNVIKKGDPDVPTEFTKNKLFKISWVHNIDLKARPGTTFNFNINAQSSGYNKTVPTASYQDLTNNQFNSSINYGYTFGDGRYNITASMRHSQNTQTKDVSLSLPDINFSVNSFAIFARKEIIGASRWYENIRVGYNMQLKNQVNVKDFNLFTPQVFDSLNNGVIHQLPIQLPTIKILKYFTLSPQFRYQEYWYTKTYEKTWYESTQSFKETYNNETRRAYDWNTSASLTTRLFGFFDINKWNLMTIRHTVTSSVDFNYRPDFAQPQYQFYRYDPG
ncbi:MAG: LPS-assembly protein LptD [Bacteroidetes bacterium]|nr:LPS-assembly protein LptD [Bacteroidota bacterium]